MQSYLDQHILQNGFNNLHAVGLSQEEAKEEMRKFMATATSPSEHKSDQEPDSDGEVEEDSGDEDDDEMEYPEDLFEEGAADDEDGFLDFVVEG